MFSVEEVMDISVDDQDVDFAPCTRCMSSVCERKHIPTNVLQTAAVCINFTLTWLPKWT